MTEFTPATHVVPPGGDKGASAPTAGGVPPTNPGPRPRAMPRINATCAWAITMGIVGLWIPLVGLAGITLGIVGLRRPRVRSSEESGKALAITGIVTGAAGLFITIFALAIFSGLYTTLTATRDTVSAGEVLAVQQAAQRFAQQNGAYPVHMAELLLSSELGVEPGTFLIRSDDANSSGSMQLGGINFATLEDSETAHARARAALDAIDPAEPFYTFGSWRFARLPMPTNDGDIVFCWRANPGDWPIFIMDDGSIHMGDSWRRIWEDDALARKRRGLPAETPERIPGQPAAGDAAEE